jgi:hypothetical protein
MTMTACILFTLLAEALLFRVPPVEAQSSTAEQAKTASDVTPFEDVEQSQGPFSLVGQSVTVVLHNKRLRTASNLAFGQTLVALEIRDKSGAALYQKTFPAAVQGQSFRQSVTASARLITGGSFAALLIRYVTAPAPLGNAGAWQLFHFLNGRLVLFDKPVSARPGPGPFNRAIAMGANGARPGGFGAQGDLVELRVWTGNFYVLVPLRVDWPHSQLSPGEQCFEMEGGGLRETGCELRVEADRKPVGADMTFVRLFREAIDNEYGVRHLVLNKNSKIEFLAAKALATWSPDGDAMKVNLFDLWLKVLIDDNDENLGWIHTEEDFAAVGLPSVSPVP